MLSLETQSDHPFGETQISRPLSFQSQLLSEPALDEG
jgi:hypothetical protein